MSHDILNLSKRLIAELNSQSIEYCFWKNNNTLIKGLNGEDDLDILLRQDCYANFLHIITSLGFKEAYYNKIIFPYIFHFYGLDAETGKFLHLHVHLRMITGESHTKNFHLPLEKMLFDNKTYDPFGCIIPRPEAELIIFILRYYIKISCLPGAILFWKRIRAFEMEFNHVHNHIEMKIVISLLENYFQHISIGFFKKMYEAYVNKTAMVMKIFIGFHLRRKISHLHRLGTVESFNARYYQIFVRLINKLFIREKKFIKSGGAIIAITGLDATGKSTITYELHRWLSANFNTRCLHVGRPKARIETSFFRAVLMFKKLISSKSKLSKLKPKKQNAIFSIRYLFLAYERFQVLRTANRLRANAYIVICDRYPSLDVGKMDSPRIAEDKKNSAFVNFIGQIERKLYNKMPIPDMMYNLKVPINIAIERNKLREKINKETDAQLTNRHLKNSNLNYHSHIYEDIDTTQDLSIVLMRLKEKIWLNL